MIIIRHRVNSLLDLEATSQNYGIEVDVRSHGSRLFLSHDPFKSGEPLDEWIEGFKHPLLVVNVKEDGLEDEIVRTLKTNNVPNYFFLDQAMPTIVRRGLIGLLDSALRYSEYEPMESVHRLKSFASWVWVDSFHQASIETAQLESLQLTGLGVCLVSPEVHAPNRLGEAAELKKRLEGSYHLLDAVCTKVPEMWLHQ